MSLVLLLSVAVDPAEFIAMAKKSETDGMVVLKEGKTVVEYAPGKRVHVQSVSKTMVSLAAGCLRTDGKLPSLDVTLGEVFPKLKGDAKEKVTLRQLLTHVSGVAHPRNEKGNNSEAFKAVRDTRAYAFGQPLEEAPETKWRYNNTGMILAAAMVEAIAGESLPRYLERRLFRPMGLRSVDWMKDRAGNAYGYMGLVIDAGDLAKIGQLVLDEGMWEGRQLIAAEWMRESTRVAAYPALSKTMGITWFTQATPAVIHHSGDGGNWLVVLPELKVVAARVRGERGEDTVNFPLFVYQRMK